ncbi:MAG: efflux RND transporter periplasmic adaptor subunit [Candidatus Omnitrophica bacterium]|nr:efflux RND transporter periplasmic adaptor subunit [Candidatus Omnitrophota bacterium]
MIKRKNLIILAIVLVIIAAASMLLSKTKHKVSKDIVREISPVVGSIKNVITATATVEPQNRLEIKPSIGGRIEEILVKEGDTVKDGQVLAWMSSTERAALLDAAQAKGAEELKYWQDVYKPTPLISPIDGEVIVCKDYPGQTVATTDVVMVLSDHLIVQAQVDETDIGKVKVAQKATITLDAYPQIKITGKVNHIYYESETVNNVVIYYADILPDRVPDVFRSGMSATAEIVENEKQDVLTVPAEAITGNEEGQRIAVVARPGNKPEERIVETGLSDDKNVEIVSGLSESDKVLVRVQKYEAAKEAKSGGNPFMPSRKKK